MSNNALPAPLKVLVWVDVTSLAGERVRRTLTAFASVQSAGVFQVYFTPKLFEGGSDIVGSSFIY